MGGKGRMRMTKSEAERRAGMRARLRDWGGSNRLLREMEKQRLRLGRGYDRALEELSRARRRLAAAPEDAALRAAAREATEQAEKVASSYADAYGRLREQVAALEAASARLDAQIARLSRDEQRLLRLRYVRCLSWTAIARIVYRSATNARYCERVAVDKLLSMDAQKG